MSSGATGNTPGNEVSNWTLAEMSAGSMSLAELLQEPLILTRSDLRTHRRRATMPFGSHVSSRRAVSNASWLTLGSMQVNRRSRRAKTDRIDLAKLLRALIAWCGSWRTLAFLATPPSEQDLVAESPVSREVP